VKEMKAKIEKFIILGKITAVMLGMVLLLGHTDKSNQKYTQKQEKIFVSFDGQNQDFETQVLPLLTKIAIKHPSAVLVHGYETRNYCETSDQSSQNCEKVLDKLENLFGDRQINIVNEQGVATQIEKEKMAKMSLEEMSQVYLIGPSEDSIEKEIYEKMGSTKVILLSEVQAI